MRIYLAVTSPGYMDPKIMHGADILSSYWYMRGNKSLQDNLPYFRDFMLDSGIFTFINSGKKVNLEQYVTDYANFIKQFKIKNYVELDVDQIIGVKETRKLRDKLESLVGYPSIPVWHTIRGKDSFVEDSKQYDRICLGYYLTEGISPATTIKYTPWFITTAHEHNCRIHGLGFTQSRFWGKFHFDSVDSSTWSFGQRGGNVFLFDINTKKILTYQKPENKRIVDYKPIMEHNFMQWKLYSDYARYNIPTVW